MRGFLRKRYLNWNLNIKINHSVSRFGKHEKILGGGKHDSLEKQKARESQIEGIDLVER